MDVRYFLSSRLSFLRQLYATSTAPYVERKRQIEAEEEPFSSPPYDESGEPAFLEEWLEADDSIQVLGRASISMLAATLKVYLETWRKIVGAPADSAIQAQFKKNWLVGYKAYFSQHAGVSFENCPVDLAILEELVLARNSVQHPSSLTTGTSRYSDADLQKLPHPFFVDETMLDLSSPPDEGRSQWLLLPDIHVTPEKFEAAVMAVEKFAEWLESGEGQATAPPR